MKILFLAPIPPPLTGQSVISNYLKNRLILNKHELSLINLSKDNLFSVNFSIKRLFQSFIFFFKLFKHRNDYDIFYHTISQSFLGNLKDIIIYIILYFKLSKLIIHLHGGGIKRELWDRNIFLYKINRFFLLKIGGVIILGNSHIEIVKDILVKDKIFIIPNFAEEQFFLTKPEIIKKFNNVDKVIVLFMSNLMKKKGYQELLQSYFLLPDNYKSKIELVFAGEFQNRTEKHIFIDKIKNDTNIRYLGIVDGEMKNSLLASAHILCLPTTLLEGQPVCILEAYASGCIVLTTEQPGILDVFKNKINGYSIESEPISISKQLISFFHTESENKKIALHNYEHAKLNLTEDLFYENICISFQKVLGKQN